MTRQQITEAITTAIDARNHEAARLNTVEFNPATRPVEYRAQQQVIEELQALHTNLLAQLHELDDDGGDGDTMEDAHEVAREMCLDCELNGDVLVVYERGVGRNYYDIEEGQGYWYVTKWEWVGSLSYYDPPECRDSHEGTYETAQDALNAVGRLVG